MIIKLLIEGGDMKPGPAIAQKLGPLGINIGKVIQEINSTTQEFKGLKVPIELDVDAKTKKFSISVKSPSISELIKKELGIEKATGAAKKLKSGNLAIEQIIKIAKTKQQNMLDKNLKAAVKSAIGSCVSLGVLIESEEPKKISQQLVSGKYDEEIKSGKTQVSSEKQEKLKQEFEQIRKTQEELIKKEEEAKAAEEAAKAAAPQAAAPQAAPENKEEKPAVAAPEKKK